MNSSCGERESGHSWMEHLQGWLTLWTGCCAEWSEIWQDMMWWQLTHRLDEMWCKMVRNSTTPCKMMVDSLPGQNVMQDGQKFNNTLQDDDQLTSWTKCDARWSEIQHLARRQSTHFLDKMWCKMVRKFNNTWDNGQLTTWTKCNARWSEIQQHLTRWWSTHFLDETRCKMVRDSTTPCKTMVSSQTGQDVMWDGQKSNNTSQDNGWLTSWMKGDTRWSEIQQHLARWWSAHKLDEMWCKMVRNLIPCETMVDSQAEQNVMWDGQKFNSWDDSQLTFWIKCDARWSEIQ